MKRILVCLELGFSSILALLGCIFQGNTKTRMRAVRLERILSDEY